jgi:hypothetical protein
MAQRLQLLEMRGVQSGSDSEDVEAAREELRKADKDIEDSLATIEDLKELIVKSSRLSIFEEGKVTHESSSESSSCYDGDFICSRLA